MASAGGAHEVDYPAHPIPRTVTLEHCIAYHDTIPVDHNCNLVYPIRDHETEVVNRFNFELHERYPWIILFGGEMTNVFSSFWDRRYVLTLDRVGLGAPRRRREATPARSRRRSSGPSR